MLGTVRDQMLVVVFIIIIVPFIMLAASTSPPPIPNFVLELGLRKLNLVKDIDL